MLGSCIARGLVLAASVLLHTGVGAGAASAEENGSLDRALERSLPDVTRWLAQDPIQDRFLARFDLKPAHIPARNAAHSPVELGVPLPERAELVAIPLGFTLPALFELTVEHYCDSTCPSDAHLRFADIGAMLSFPLSALSDCFGRWKFSAGAHFVLFETELRTGSGEPNQWIGCAGFSTSF
jgi:hypothetical protein